MQAVRAGTATTSSSSSSSSSSGGITDLEWVANCSKCGVLGPFQCAEVSFKRHMSGGSTVSAVSAVSGGSGGSSAVSGKRKKKKKIRPCGFFKINPRMTWRRELYTKEYDEYDEDEIISHGLYDGLFVIYRPNISECVSEDVSEGVSGGVSGGEGKSRYRVGRVSDYEYGGSLCCLQIYDFIPQKGNLSRIIYVTHSLTHSLTHSYVYFLANLCI
jgi:hypothetical protein